MNRHPSMPLDLTLIDEIDSRLDLRAPNREALEKVAECVGEAAGSSIELVCDLATAVGKTYLAAGIIEYFAHLGVRNILIITPGRTILDKTVANFTAGHQKSILDGMEADPTVITVENFNSGAVAAALEREDTLKLFVFNVQSLIKPDKATRKTRKFQEWLGGDLYKYLTECSDLLIISDEHHVYSENALAYSAAVRNLDPLALVGLTATPSKLDREKVVFHYPLARAIAEKFVKTPVLVGRTDKVDGREIQLRDGLNLLAAKQKACDAYSSARSAKRINAVMFVVCDCISTSEEIGQILARIYGDEYAKRVLTVHSKASDDALARLDAVEDPNSDVRVIVSVDMLKEGWDVKNIFVICSFRPSISDALTEQTLGRGLRLPWGKYTDIELLDTVEILSHERYEALLRKAEVLLEGLVETRAVVKPTEIPGVVVVVDDGKDAPGTDADLVLPEGDVPDQQSSVDPAGITTSGGNTHTPVPVSPDDGAVGLPIVVGLDERQREADEQAAQVAKPVLPRALITMPEVERQVSPKPPLVLSELPDTLFETLGKQVAAAGSGSSLARKRLNIVLDSSSPTGLRLVPTDTEDVIDAARPGLPFLDAAVVIKRAMLSSDLVRDTEKSDKNAARRLAEVLVAAAGGEDKVSPYVQQVVPVVLRMIQSQYRAAPEQVSYKVSAAEWGPVRTNARPVELNRYGTFKRGLAYDSWKPQCLYPVNWFDTEPERRMANMLDEANASRVPVWTRIQRGEFVILWYGGRYSPDFYAAIDGVHYLIETKGDDRKDMGDVQAKKAEAERWARYVTDEMDHGEWRYLFVTQSALKTSKTLDDVLALASLPAS